MLSIAARTAGVLWLDVLSMMASSPGVQFRYKDTGLTGVERIGVHRSIEHPECDYAGTA